ncbi:interphotoreceptor matrix proteoglycan 2 [Diretmus argenteus]
MRRRLLKEAVRRRSGSFPCPSGAHAEDGSAGPHLSSSRRVNDAHPTSLHRAPTPSVLVVGSSLVRHVSVRGGRTFCYPGACVKDITSSALQVLNQHSSAAAVVLEAGLNDLKYQQSELLKEDFTRLAVSLLDTDNTNTNFGGLNRAGRVNVHTKVKDSLQREVIGLGCPAHIIHNATRTALGLIPLDVEVLKMYAPLKAFFLSEDKCPIVLRRIFEDPLTELWLAFAHGNLSMFSDSIKQLEGQDRCAVESAAILKNLEFLEKLVKDRAILKKIHSSEKYAHAAFEGSSMGSLSLAYSQELPKLLHPRITQLSDVKVSHDDHGAVSRQKRNILFPSGIKLCAHETVEQVAASHLSYFHLRVCQETVWEAFKIFWDRLPAQEEYQSWMSQCQDGTVTARDIGIYFSQSQEHQTLVKTRMSRQELKSTESPEEAETPKQEAVADSEDTAEGEGEAAIVPEVEEVAVVTEAHPLDNDIAVEPPTSPVLEQVVELSILLTGETYSEELKDAASLQYQTLKRQFIEKIEDALEGLPGFKSVSVLEFRSVSLLWLDGVVVDYVVTVLVDGPGISTEQMDYLTLQSNQVENSYYEMQESPTVVYTISEVRNYDNEALHKEELEIVSESVHPSDDEATVNIMVETPEVPALEGHTDDVDQDDFLSDGVAVVVGENDVIILEESATESPVPVSTTTAHKDDSIEEEGLLLEDTVQNPNTLSPPLEQLPPEPPSLEQPEVVTLPEPPVETEASGSDTGALEDLLWPATTTAEEEAYLEETAAEDGLIVEDKVAVEAETISEEDSVEKEVAAVGEEPAAEDTVTVEEAGEAHLDEVDLNTAEVPQELEISTIMTEIIEEEDLPVLITAPDVVEETSDLAGEASEPAEVGLLPVNIDSVDGTAEELNIPDGPPAVEEVLPEQPEDDTAINVVPAYPEPSEYGKKEEPIDKGVPVEEATEKQGQEVQEGVVPEAPVVEQEASEAPEISTEDLTEDEILMFDKAVSELPVTHSQSPAQPTALSPERVSPITSVSGVRPAIEGQPDMGISITMEVQTTEVGLSGISNEDLGYDVVHYGYDVTNHTEEGGSGFPSGVVHGTDQASISMPVSPGRALMVFFSLRVTNMIFSEDLFNKNSPEYKALEQRFLELLVPYLQSNLSNFQNLEILNFRNGSIVVNSRMKFGKPVPHGVTSTVYLILEDFCNTAYQTMNLAIDKYSLDVESGDQADPCKFQACNEYAECKVNKWTGEAECVCNAGYFSMEGLPCQSICDLQTDFCLNDGKCDIIPGQGAICRCRVGENWWYRGEHCEEYVSEPLVVGIAIASVAGFLLVASGVIFFLARTLRDQYDKDESEDPIRRAESLPSLERATKYNPMYESEATTGYSHYYRRYPEAPVYSSASAEASTDFSSEEIRHIYENSELTKEEIQDRIRIIELYAKDRQFADLVRQHQA